MIEPAVDALLGADAGGLGGIARPALHRVAAAEADVERAANVALRALAESPQTPASLPAPPHRWRAESWYS